eukprot:1635539-Rhodomonas_salina.1
MIKSQKSHDAASSSSSPYSPLTQPQPTHSTKPNPNSNPNPPTAQTAAQTAARPPVGPAATPTQRSAYCFGTAVYCPRDWDEGNKDDRKFLPDTPRSGARGCRSPSLSTELALDEFLERGVEPPLEMGL